MGREFIIFYFSRARFFVESFPESKKETSRFFLRKTVQEFFVPFFPDFFIQKYYHSANLPAKWQRHSDE